MAAFGMNKNVNSTTETWITTSTPYFTETNSKFVVKPEASTFPIATTETFEITQTPTSITLSSASEDLVEIIRRHVTGMETTGTLVCRDFKPELIEIANAAVKTSIAEAPATGTKTVKKLGEFFVFEGIQKPESFTLKVGAKEFEEGTHYTLSKGAFQVNEVQPVDGIAVGNVLIYDYVKKASTRFQAGKKGAVYGIITVIGYRHTEDKNNLYKLTVRVQLDPSPFIGQSAEDFASSTITFTVLKDPNGNSADGTYTLDLVTDDDA